MNIATVSKINIYPIKSFPPVTLSSATIGLHSLKMDRQYALFDEYNKVINAKRYPKVNQLSTSFDLTNQTIRIQKKGSPIQIFELHENNPELLAFFNDFFETKVSILKNEKGELLDIPRKSSVTLLGKKTIKSLQQEINNYDSDNLKLRFRANIEFDGVTAYWEDQLFHQPGNAVHFTIGDVNLFGMSPCERCNVPPQNPIDGSMDKTFAKKLMQHRKAHLPENSFLPTHGGFYHLGVNVYIPENEQNKTINIGDKIEIVETIKLG